MINRLCSLPPGRSFFLFGARQSGKSTLVGSYLKNKKFWSVNLLHSETFFLYSREPSLFRKEAISKVKNGVRVIFVDEIQRIPELLNEVHFLIEETKCIFILTGSSARKLKRGGANLLAGRAVVRYLYPFTAFELGEKFDLEPALRFGTLPPVALAASDEERIDILNAYGNTFIKEEIQAEGLSRNIGGFSRFLEIAASCSGELVNFSAIARDAALSMGTVQNYFDILEDTLIALKLEAWTKSPRKRMVLHPRYYFFDLGVLNALNRHVQAAPDRALRGRLFEHFIILETQRLLSYFNKSNIRIFSWRTSNGAEVALVFEKGGKIISGVEIKSTPRVSRADLTGLSSFHEDHPSAKKIVVCTAENGFDFDLAQVMPWKDFLHWITKL